MISRLVSIFLIALSGLLFYSNYQQKKSADVKIATLPSDFDRHEIKIMENQFLVLMEEEYLDEGPRVLKDLGFRVAGAMGDWLQVSRADAPAPEPVATEGLKADQQHHLLALLINQPEIHSATFNFVQTGDDAFLSCQKEEVSIANKMPDDPFLKRQWYLGKTGINAELAWNITQGDAKNMVAVVDRYFDLDQEELNPERCHTRRIFYENILDYFWSTQTTKGEPPKYSHGSQVLGVLAPCTGNEAGLASVDWRTQVFAVDSKSDRSLAARMLGVLWAAGVDVCPQGIAICPPGSHFQKNHHPANVINSSFGFAGSYLADPPYAPVLDIIGQINRRGSILVASAGNESSQADRRLPGAAGGVISVGATNRQEETAYFSNFGRTIDVMAPGQDILSVENNEPVMLNGTSFSAPLVTGVASLLLAVNPNFSWKHMEHILKASARPMSCEQYCPEKMDASVREACRQTCCVNGENVCSAGLVDAVAALKMAQLGIPKTPLIDVDDYYIPLSEHRGLTSRVMVKNWGQSRAIVRAKNTNAHLKMDPKLFVMDPASADGVPSVAYVNITYDKTPKSSTVITLILEAASPAQPNNFADRIEAIAQINPDNPKGPRKLKELFY
jgi:hypothetical protein